MNIRDHIKAMKERDYMRETERRSRESELTSEDIASHVAEYLARGGRIEELPSYVEAPPVTRVRAFEGWI